MAQPVADKKPFFMQKPDDKYSVLNRPIGVDTSTSFLSTRVVDASNSVAAGDSLLGKTLDYDFTASPSALIDWDNSVLETRMLFSNAAGSGVATGVVPWNLILAMFEEIHVQFNGQTVYSKTAGDYCACQTMKWLSEHTKESLNASTAVFAPVGDELYSNGIKSAAAIAAATSPKTAQRNSDWITSVHTDQVVKLPTLKDLLFSMGLGLPKNLRTVKISLKFKSSIPLGKVTEASDGICKPISPFRIHLHEYNFSSSSAITALDSKLNGEDEHLCFIDVESRKLPWSSDMSVTSQKDVQWVAVAQFGHEFTNAYPGSDSTNTASMSNCGQLYVLNGYSSAATTPTAVLLRADQQNTTACKAPAASAQIQLGGMMYPYNAMRLQNPGNTTLLDTSELYREYCRGVKKLTGILSPAIDEATFKRTMPFIFVKPTANNKLLQSSDIVVRLPGFDKGSNTGTAELRILYGKLKAFNLAPSGVVSEAVSSY
jgi:hypothetical protein